MRKTIAKQLPIVPNRIEHEHAEELRRMSELLDAVPQASRLVARDLVGTSSASRGRRGMSGEQVLRALILKQMTGLSYERLAFHLADSASYRAFCRIGVCDTPPSASCLHANIKRIRDRTLEKVNRLLVHEAIGLGLDDGTMARIDSTAVESNIHHPTDSSLLSDAVRMLTAELRRLSELTDVQFSDHTRRAKKRALRVTNAKSARQREHHYRDLIKVTGWTLGYARDALFRLRDHTRACIVKRRIELQRLVHLTERVLDQAQRRIFQGETVSAADKVVSLVEPHTDVLVKGGRDTQYGHKVFVTVGRSGMILDMLIERGNPADMTRVETLLTRHRQHLGKVPEQACFDAGFTSSQTVDTARELGVGHAAFAKKSGVDVMKAARSSWLYRQLMRARAGVEGVISFLKRCFGFGRCTWRSFGSFRAYAWASVLSANLLIAARLAMTT